MRAMSQLSDLFHGDSDAEKTDFLVFMLELQKDLHGLMKSLEKHVNTILVHGFLQTNIV